MTKAIKISGTMKEFEVTVLPEGSYELSIIKVDEQVSKNNNQMLTLDFSVMSGDYTSKTFRDWFTVTDKTFWKLAQLLEAADPNCEVHEMIPTGETDADGDEVYTLELADPTALVGCCLIADCKPGEDNQGRARTVMGNLYPMEQEGDSAPTNGAEAATPAPPVQEAPTQAAPPPQQEQGTRRRRPRPRQ